MTTIRIGELDRAIREEMFNLHAQFVNPNASEKVFFSKRVEVKELDLSSIPNSELYKLSPEQVDGYNKTLSQPSTKFSVISGDKLIDGLHRISAAKMKGKKTLEVVDFGKLINPKESGYQLKIKILPENENHLSI
ncbi:TPA: hypothetical protein MYP09_001410 [Citrobacter farmeri]|nr:hypothetical protein [Citrobacter farmeri]